MRRAAPLATILLLAACVARQAPPQAAEQLDGIYAGTVTEDAACGTEVRTISFQVTGRTITAQGGHRRSHLAGSVSVGGQVDMQNGSGGNPVIGSIVNGTLIATEIAAAPGHRKHTRSSLDDPMALPCIWRYEATRAAGAG